MKVVIQGIRATQQGVAQLQARARVGGRDAVSAMGVALEGEIKNALSKTSHRRGTPTPSKPGEPPSVIGGTLRRSVRTDIVQPTGPDTFRTNVGPTVIYARVQELGGETGRGHKVRLLARPYLGPSNQNLIENGRYEDVAVAAFRRALTT